ncbi:HNH endonuclease signature motif containing protein [Rossellomorea vietnamensis]|uniref:HNH endonuclease signature motif containing protein n=1 Tax=Rossellomorea vietnamensis TaxID=218284 RepID=UPI001E3E40B9|nr:HNH endonuclease signature motif containing protein [Rossellomorea vietnamensis]MCC5801840.1 HNH endonuclease [Rossellomorea vietnamensis]
MAKSRYVPIDIRRELIEEAGNKCANPGCPVTCRYEFHHIKEWAVYKVHNADDMIAICPTCHSYVHSGRLKISDEKLRDWKKITRKQVASEKTDQIFIEKGKQSSMVVGPLTIKSNNGAIPFRMLDQVIEYRIENGNLYFLNINLKRADGKDFFTATHNILSTNLPEGVSYDYYAGKVLIKAAVGDNFLPGWAIKEIRQFAPDFATNGVTVLDIEVIGQGAVKIAGLVMVAGDVALVVHEDEIYYVVKGTVRPWIFSETLDKVPFLPKVVDYKGSDNNTIPYIEFNPNSRGK